MACERQWWILVVAVQSASIYPSFHSLGLLVNKPAPHQSPEPLALSVPLSRVGGSSAFHVNHSPRSFRTLTSCGFVATR